jgi:NADPH:quinone reductase-like Zn-dependent oxidoreductase
VYYENNEGWADELLQLNQGKNFDAVLDCIGPANANATLKLLGVDGRWVFYGTLSGIKGELNFGQMISKRVKLISTTLKTRSK